MSNLYEYLEQAENYFNKDEKIPQNVIKPIYDKVKNQGYIGLAQINPAAGDIEFNAKKIVKYIKYASDIGLDTIIFPELSLVGAPLGDAIAKFPVIAEDNIKWLKGVAKISQSIMVIVGFLEPADSGQYYSSIAVIKNGEVVDIVRKSINKDMRSIVDYKYFISSNTKNCGRNDSYNFKILIGDDCISLDCADYTDKTCIINPSLVSNFSQFNLNKNRILSETAIKSGVPIVHINRVGATDTVSFDGYSCVYDSDGKLIAQAKSFEEQLLVANPITGVGKIYSTDSNNHNTRAEFSLDYECDLERVYKTLIQGIKDYFDKCGLKRAVLGLSGGLDSTVCAVLLADAIGKENVFGVSMPSKITSAESKSDAEKLASNLGINFTVCPIKDVVSTTSQTLEDLFNNVEIFWSNRYKESYTQDNIQARARATYLWAISNEFPSCIPIATSDKSEAYMGYATINGDMSGGFAPIADITKTKLFALAKWLNKNRQEKDVIPQSIIDKKPGAELAINPKTGKPLEAEEALMPYEFLDEIIWRIENKKESYRSMLESKFIYEKNNNVTRSQKEEWLNKFFKRMSSALYKWSIMPPSIRVEEYTINKSVYYQPIISGKINYNGVSDEYITSVLDKN